MDEREGNAFERSCGRASNAARMSRKQCALNHCSLRIAYLLVNSVVVLAVLFAGRREQTDIVGSEDAVGGGAVGGEKGRE